MAVLADGSLGLLGTDVDVSGASARLSTGIRTLGGSLSGTAQSLAARGAAGIWRFDGEALHNGPTMPLESPALKLPGFADGRWLVAATNAGDEPEARLFAPGGTLLKRLRLGDAIECLDVDANDRIWAGWFDEGVFSNMERFPDALNQTAIVAGCFTADGALLPVGPVPQAAGFPFDVYAMTVTDEGAWICPYTEFPLIHLRPNQPVRWWRNALAGADAIATDGHHVLLAGSYGDEAPRVALIALRGDGQGEDVEVLACWRLPPVQRIPPKDEHPSLAEQVMWERPALLSGKCDMLHLIVGNAWYRWRVADAVDALRQM